MSSHFLYLRTERYLISICENENIELHNTKEVYNQCPKRDFEFQIPYASCLWSRARLSVESKMAEDLFDNGSLILRDD